MKQLLKPKGKFVPLTHMHDPSLSWIGTDTSIKGGMVKLVLWTQSSPGAAVVVIVW